jgi:hypothetical protein
MSRTLVLPAFLAAWLATGILAGVVMSRRDRFPWWLLGVAFGPVIVPLALGTERREQQPAGRARSPQPSQDQSVPVITAIDDRRQAAAALAEDDVVHVCGLGSFPASDPPSWWG